MRKLWILGLVALLCAVAGACGSTTTSGTSSGGYASGAVATTEPTPATSAAANAVDWNKASSHIGESVTVRGPVVGATYAESSNGSPTFLNVGADYPDPSRFTVVIWGEDRGNFKEAPEDQYSGQTIRVTGTVSDYKGVPQIEVSSQSEIEVVQ
jgi:DNA/RNA endonuclease YhcR with UshA esterase domain